MVKSEVFLYLQLIKGDDPVITAVKNVVTKNGYHIRQRQDSSLFYEALKAGDIPMGEIEKIVKKDPQTTVCLFNTLLFLNNSFKYTLEPG